MSPPRFPTFLDADEGKPAAHQEPEAGVAYFGVRRLPPLSRFGLLRKEGRRKKRRQPPHSIERESVRDGRAWAVTDASGSEIPDGPRHRFSYSNDSSAWRTRSASRRRRSARKARVRSSGGQTRA